MEEELTRLREECAQLKDVVQKALLNNNLQLKDLPHTLQEDPEWILKAIEINSVSWYDLDQKWKDDPEVACVYFKRQRKEPSLLQTISFDEVKNALAWKDLPYNLKVNRDVLFHALQTYEGPAWEEIPCQFHSDIDLLATAVVQRKVRLEAVPVETQKKHPKLAFYSLQSRNSSLTPSECVCFTRETMKDLLENDLLEHGEEFQWSWLPPDLQTDVSFAMNISFRKCPKLPEMILDNIVEIRSEKSFWLTLLHQGQYNFRHLLVKYAPNELLSDHGFMLEICEMLPRAFTHVGDNLAHDRSFVEAALENNAKVLEYLSGEAQENNKDLVLKAISTIGQLEDIDLYDVSEAILPSFWMDFDFAMTWLRAGLGFPMGSSAVINQVRQFWSSDRFFCLEDAKYGGSSLCWVNTSLRSDLVFMMEAVANNPKMYSAVCDSLKDNPCIVIMACSASPKLAKDKMVELHFQGKDQLIDMCCSGLRGMLGPYETFISCILPNMLSTQSVDDTGTNLTLLNEGTETSLKYKKLLAEYLGIPTGIVLTRFQKAEKNILEAIKPWAKDVQNVNNT